MANNFYDTILSPFDVIISFTPWAAAAAAIALAIYILVRSLFTLRNLRNIKHELSAEEVRFMKIQTTLNIFFSTVFMTYGLTLIVYLQ